MHCSVWRTDNQLTSVSCCSQFFWAVCHIRLSQSPYLYADFVLVSILVSECKCDFRNCGKYLCICVSPFKSSDPSKHFNTSGHHLPIHILMTAATIHSVLCLSVTTIHTIFTHTSPSYRSNVGAKYLESNHQPSDWRTTALSAYPQDQRE